MSGLGTWVVDGAYSLRWEEQADGTSGELSLGADTGAELQLTGSPMSLSRLLYAQPSLACVPGAVPSLALTGQRQGLESSGCVLSHPDHPRSPPCLGFQGPGGCGEQGILGATLSETWLWPSPSARGARTPSAGTLKVDTSMPHATCSFLPD